MSFQSNLEQHSDPHIHPLRFRWVKAPMSAEPTELDHTVARRVGPLSGASRTAGVRCVGYGAPDGEQHFVPQSGQAASYTGVRAGTILRRGRRSSTDADLNPRKHALACRLE